MSTATPAIQDLVRRLIDSESAGDPPDDAPGRVLEKLRAPLVRLAGVAGYRSLLTRAVSLAAAGSPAIAPVRVGAEGSLEGCDAADGRQCPGPRGEAGVAILTQLIGLLVLFIGEPLTLGLVRDAWPDTRLGDTRPTPEVRP